MEFGLFESPTDEKPTIEAQWLKSMPYSEAYELQLELASKAADSGKISVLGLEHPAVVTMGLRSDEALDLNATPEELKRSGLEIQHIRRGGEATLHSPGQLVIYPIVPLRKWGFGVRDFVQTLMDVTQETLAELGIETVRKGCEPGLYSMQGKIAFFGLQVKRGVSLHGLSINVNNNLDLFANIRSCGVENESFDKVANHHMAASNQANATPQELFSLWMNGFRRQLGESRMLTS